MSGISADPSCDASALDRMVVWGTALCTASVQRREIQVLNDYQRDNPNARVLLIKVNGGDVFRERLSPEAIEHLVQMLTKPIPLLPEGGRRVLADE